MCIIYIHVDTFINIDNYSFSDEVCTMDTSITNGDYTPKQQVYYPDQQIRIQCKPGYEVDRLSPVETCLKNGTWFPLAFPRCLSQCLRLYW